MTQPTGDPTDAEISFAEARGRLGVHSATLRRWIAAGRLPVRQHGDGRLLVRLADVERLRGDADPRDHTPKP